MLTKTAYLTYTQCPKAFWLDTYQPDLAAPPDPSRQRHLRAGQEVDVLAGEQFPDACAEPRRSSRLIPYRPRSQDMALLT